MLRAIPSLILAAVCAAGPASAQGGFLGVHLEPAAEGESGVRIARVEERSAATVMGLQAGDLVTAVDGIAVADPAALSGLISGRLPGEMVEVTVTRSGESRTLLGVLARRPGAPREPGPFAGRRMQGFPNLEFSAPMRLELPEFRFEDLQSRLEELERHHAELMRQLQENLQDMDWNFEGLEGLENFGEQDGGFSLRFEGEPGQVFLHPGEPLRVDEHTSVRLRYPASTPEADRERLIREAEEKYGAGVEVEFAGTGTAVIIQRQSSASGPAAPAAPAPPVPPGQTREF